MNNLKININDFDDRKYSKLYYNFTKVYIFDIYRKYSLYNNQPPISFDSFIQVIKDYWENKLNLEQAAKNVHLSEKYFYVYIENNNLLRPEESLEKIFLEYMKQRRFKYNDEYDIIKTSDKSIIYIDDEGDLCCFLDIGTVYNIKGHYIDFDKLYKVLYRYHKKEITQRTVSRTLLISSYDFYTIYSYLYKYLCELDMYYNNKKELCKTIYHAWNTNVYFPKYDRICCTDYYFINNKRKY